MQAYLEKNYSALNGKVLTIHTNKSGDISEKVTGKAKEELDRLRKEANAIDGPESPYQVIVSVLMLKEGWDVKNSYHNSRSSSICGGIKHFTGANAGAGFKADVFGQEDVEEYVSVVGTPAFMDFVESIKAEGVELEKRKWTALQKQLHLRSLKLTMTIRRKIFASWILSFRF